MADANMRRPATHENILDHLFSGDDWCGIIIKDCAGNLFFVKAPPYKSGKIGPVHEVDIRRTCEWLANEWNMEMPAFDLVREVLLQCAIEISSPFLGRWMDEK